MDLDYLLLEKFEGENITGNKTYVKINRLTETQKEIYARYHKYLLDDLKPVDGRKVIEKTKEMSEERYNELVYIHEKNFRLQPLNAFKTNRKVVLDFMEQETIKTCYFSEYDKDIFINFIDQYRQFSSMRLRNYCEMFLKFIKYIDPSFNKIDIKMLMKESGDVPIWEEYYPNIHRASKEQKEFYKIFKEFIDGSEVLDIEGQLAYCFVYLYDKVDDFTTDKDIEKLELILKNVISKYGNYESIASYVYQWLRDANYLKKKYIKAWEYLLEGSKYSGLRIKWEDIINIRYRYSKTKLTGEEYLTIINNNRITSYIKENEDNRILLMKSIEKYFDGFRRVMEKEFVTYYLDEFSYEKIPSEILKEVESQYSDDPKIMKYAKQYITHLNVRRREVTKKDDINTKKVRILSSEVFIKSYPPVAYEILDYELSNLLRELENNIRVENGIAKIGEGWISEAQLYYEVKKEFNNEIVVHQGKPKWLGNQRFDIYLPKFNIAIEYQGEQHGRPIVIFGGEEGFKKIQELDQNKKQKCIENNCKLIYVYPKYKKESVIKEIRDAMR